MNYEFRPISTRLFIGAAIYWLLFWWAWRWWGQLHEWADLWWMILDASVSVVLLKEGLDWWKAGW